VGNEVTTLLGLVHCTTEQGRKLGTAFESATVSVNAGLPAPAEVCESEVSTGGARAVLGVVSVTAEADDVPIEFVTVTPAVPGNATAVAGMVAVSCVGVALENVVGSGAPFQFTIESLVKFVPFTVRVKPCVPQ